MLVNRWQAPMVPTKEQIKMIFQVEGLECTEEIYEASEKVKEHRHPFDEIRMVVSGRIIFNVQGHQLLLKPGDRIQVPANTKHETFVEGPEACISVVAKKPF